MDITISVTLGMHTLLTMMCEKRQMSIEDFVHAATEQKMRADPAVSALSHKCLTDMGDIVDADFPPTPFEDIAIKYKRTIEEICANQPTS